MTSPYCLSLSLSLSPASRMRCKTSRRFLRWSSTGPEKCHLCMPMVSFRGHVFSEKEVSTSPDKIKDIIAWPTPASTAETHEFLRLVSFISWSGQQEEAFQTLKTKLTTNPGPYHALPHKKTRRLYWTRAALMWACAANYLSKTHNLSEP